MKVSQHGCLGNEVTHGDDGFKLVLGRGQNGVSNLDMLTMVIVNLKVYISGFSGISHTFSLDYKNQQKQEVSRIIPDYTHHPHYGRTRTQHPVSRGFRLRRWQSCRVSTSASTHHIQWTMNSPDLV